MNQTLTKTSECGNDWYQFGNKCFKYHNDQAGANFHDAFSICEYAYSATLLTIYSEDELNFVNKLAFHVKHARYSIWLGLVRVSNESFAWFDKSHLNYTNWGPNEPNNWQSKNYCVVISSAPSAKGKWFDVSCATTYLVMCQKYLQQTPILSENYNDSYVLIADEINMKSDDLFNSEKDVERDLNRDQLQYELQYVKVLGNVNIVLTTILFIVIFVFILSNYKSVSIRRKRLTNNSFSSISSIYRNSFDI